MTALAEGRWGGTGVEFVVRKDAVSITYDCAVGEIASRPKRDNNGNFTVEGTYRRLTPGALRPGLQPAPVAVRYEGNITGKKMKYRVFLIENGESLGEFTAELGKEARLRGCR